MTSFEKKVLKAVMKIPLGEVRTYQWIAEQCGHPRACRAVGTVLKKNPWPLIIPCHRVVKSSQDVGQYNSGGARVKKRLIELEREIRSCLQSRE